MSMDTSCSCKAPFHPETSPAGAAEPLEVVNTWRWESLDSPSGLGSVPWTVPQGRVLCPGQFLRAWFCAHSRGSPPPLHPGVSLCPPHALCSAPHGLQLGPSPGSECPGSTFSLKSGQKPMSFIHSSRPHSRSLHLVLSRRMVMRTPSQPYTFGLHTRA